MLLPDIYSRIPYKAYLIDSIDLYNRALKVGFSPLLDWRHFYIPMELRKQLQNIQFRKDEFGHGKIIISNDKFYHYCFENSLFKCCEECQHPLDYYSAEYISHILTKGSKPEIAHDPRNFNLLCPKCHYKWEIGKGKYMKIYKTNQIVIELLKIDYQIWDYEEKRN